MSNNYNNQDDPTLRIPPQSPQQPYPDQGQQGKLVIGNFKDAPKPQERKPYQYQQPSPQQPQRGNVPPPYPQGPYVPPGQQPHQARPEINRYPNYQPGQLAGGPAVPPKRAKRSRRRKGCLISALVVLTIVVVLGVIGFSLLQRALAFGKVISTQQDPLSTQTGYMGISDRVNVLVMGYGGTGHDGALLTDSMLVISVLPQSHHTSLVSVPRDLQVQVPEGSGNYGKINSVYEYGSNFGKDPVGGGNAAAAKITKITGLDVKYWLTINFVGFRDFINAIGGVDVDVKDSFTSLYPKNDDPNVDASWIKVSFTKGLQHFDGEEAIRYARAREVLDNPAEGTDFARSQRQQIIIKAALSKLKQMSTWPSFYNALSALEHTIYTNLSLADLAQFALKMDLNDTKTAHIGLSTSNVLADVPGSSNLVPINNDWQQIIDYVKSNLYN